MEPTSDPCTCLKAALYWTKSLEQEAVYLKDTSHMLPSGALVLI